MAAVIHDAVKFVAGAYGVTVEDVMSESRRVPLPDARAAVWYGLNKADDKVFSLTALSKVWGRDHTTVMHGAHKVRDAKEGSRLRVTAAVVTGLAGDGPAKDGAVVEPAVVSPVVTLADMYARCDIEVNKKSAAVNTQAEVRLTTTGGVAYRAKYVSEWDGDKFVWQRAGIEREVVRGVVH